jgi:predicted AAA+ superfamily ATPase
MVLSEVLARLSGDSSVPALHRQESALGGGKTHMLIALTHLGFRGRELAEAVAPCFDTVVFDPALLHTRGEVDLVGVAGDEIPVHKPHGVDLVPYTLWGEIAFQIGGEALYRSVEAEATSQAAPGKHFLDRIFEDRRVLLLLDELAQYSARLAAAYPQGAGQLSAFLMALNGYARNHAGIAVVLTLAGQTDAFANQTEELARILSEVRGEDVTPDEAVAMAQSAHAEVLSVVSRDASGVVPVQASKMSRVLAKRLFVTIDHNAADATVSAYAQLYQQAAELLPDRASAVRTTAGHCVNCIPFIPASLNS